MDDSTGCGVEALASAKGLRGWRILGSGAEDGAWTVTLQHVNDPWGYEVEWIEAATEAEALTAAVAWVLATAKGDGDGGTG